MKIRADINDSSRTGENLLGVVFTFTIKAECF